MCWCSLQNGEASLFEVNIRYVGGLLAAYYLTGEEVCFQQPHSPCVIASIVALVGCFWMDGGFRQLPVEFKIILF